MMWPRGCAGRIRDTGWWSLSELPRRSSRAFKSGKAQKQGGRVDFCFSRQSVCVKHYYFYIDDEEFGPCFIKV